MISTAYRIVPGRLLKGALDGEGARLHGGRWNSIGLRVIYAAQSRSLASLELLAHLTSEEILRESYWMIPLRFDNDHVMEIEQMNPLPKNWRTHPAPPATRTLGDAWIRGGKSCILSVPSVLVPAERNYLINPSHPAFRKVVRGKPEPYLFDQRLL